MFEKWWSSPNLTFDFFPICLGVYVGLVHNFQTLKKIFSDDEKWTQTFLYACLTLINSFNIKERSFGAGFLIAPSSDIELTVNDNWTILVEPFWRSILSKCLDRVFHCFLGTFLRQIYFFLLKFFRHGSGVPMFIWCRQTPFPIGMMLLLCNFP